MISPIDVKRQTDGLLSEPSKIDQINQVQCEICHFTPLSGGGRQFRAALAIRSGSGVCDMIIGRGAT